MAGIVIGGTGAKGAGGKGGGKGKGGISPALKAYLSSTSLITPPQQTVNFAHALANAQTQGPLNALANQIAQTNRGTRASEKLTGGYFTQFGKSAQQGFQDTQAAGRDLQTQLQGIGANTQSALQGIGQDAQASVQKYMPAGDQSLSSPAMQSLTAEIARQRGYASQYGGIAQTSGALQSGNYSDMAAAEKGIGAIQGTQALGELARAGRLAVQPLNTQRATLDQTRGALFADALGKIHQQDITNQFTAQGLGNTRLGIASTAANEAANRAATSANEAANRRASTRNTRITQAGENQRSAAAIAARKATTAAHAVATGKKPSLTAYEQQHENANLGRAIAFVTKGKQKGIAVGQITSDAPTALGAYYDPVLLQAAIEVVQGGGTITSQTAAALHQMGIRNSTWNGKPITVRGPVRYPSGQGVTSAGQGAAGGVSSVAG